MNKSKKSIFALFLAIIFIGSLFTMAIGASAEPDKEYRSGQVLTINGKNYLIANNKEFAEIIEITADNKLYQLSEVHGVDKIEDLYAGKYLDKYFLVIATGRYLYRYDISNPAAPKIEFRRDLYTFKRGQFKIGSISNLAGNQNWLFGAGSNGVRSFNPDNLFLNKIYTLDKSYGVAADDKKLYVITETKGLVFDIASGQQLAEVDLINKDKTNRRPYFDQSGNAYFPSDKSLVKLSGDKKAIYVNPVADNQIFSYAAANLPGGHIYYVNGYGVTVLDKNFSKVKFVYTSKANRFGANSWAVGLTAAKLGSREAVIIFNKSSVLLFDKDLRALAQYKYKKLYPDYVTTDLKILPSTNTASAGQKINLRLSGFWPNENVVITFGSKSYNIKVDNQGYATSDVAVPYQSGGRVVIQAVGSDSAFSYQTVFTIL